MSETPTASTGATKLTAAPAGRGAKMPPIEQLRGRPLGRVLIKMGKLKRSQVHEALDIQKEKRGPIGSILVELGYISDEDLNVALAAQSGMGLVDLGKMDVAAEIIAMMPAQMANTYRVVPYEYDADRHELGIAMENPDNFVATDDLKTLLGVKIKASLAKPEELQKALDRYYPEGEQESIAGLIGELTDDADLARFEGRGDSIDLMELKEIADLNPVKKLLNLVLLQAIKDKASDIHFEPFEDEFKMRYRIDGVLYEMVPPPRYVALAIASRIKVMSNLDIASSSSSRASPSTCGSASCRPCSARASCSVYSTAPMSSSTWTKSACATTTWSPSASSSRNPTASSSIPARPDRERPPRCTPPSRN
jgi:type IV pilus assembly protein PilB